MKIFKKMLFFAHQGLIFRFNPNPMRKLPGLLFGCLLFAAPLLAQDAYFQQKADYRIAVKLDDSRQMLLSNIDIHYTNNAPVALDRIYMHLWPNAYKNNQTVFAKAEARSGSWDFYSAPEEKRGFIDSLDFKVNGQSVRWELLPDTIDVAVLWLAKPLAPGEQLHISTPFRVKVPGNFSRLGFSRGQYQICQWYPKPAVFDQNGWHYMPYLNMGEFYSEFGNFEVFINVPSNYQVAASGNLQTASEIAYLDSLAAYAAGIDSFPVLPLPESSTDFKTLHYRLENAHDFAWFCGKNYYVKQGEVALPNSGRKVKTAVFFSRDTKYWKKALAYVDSSVYYYSKWLGDYPYDVCTAVDGALTAGGGMEYPTITVIAGASSSKSLDEVIAHEVGHNWFYGILASNERDHPFMDEGFNSYYEERYMATRYPAMSGGKLFGISIGLDNAKMGQLLYLFSKKRGKDVSLWHTPSTGYDNETYGTLVYKRTALELNYLEAYLGTEAFDAMMQGYYESWKFKHPQPSDMRAAMQASKTGKNIDWWFEKRLQMAGKIDYRLGRVKKQGDNKYVVKVKQRGQAVPFTLAALDDTGAVMRQEWYAPVNGSAQFELQLDRPAARFSIDPDQKMPLYRRGMATARVGALVPALPELRPVAGLAYKRNQVFVLPIIGNNFRDGFMLGLGLMSPVALPQDFEYALLPMYAFGSKELVGQGMARYNWHPDQGKFKRIRSTVAMQQYSNFNRFINQNTSPVVRLQLQGLLRDPLGSTRRRELQMGIARVPFTIVYLGGPLALPGLPENRSLYLLQASYGESYRILTRPWSWQLAAEMGQIERGRGANGRLSGEVIHRWFYQTQKRQSYLDQRAFVGLAFINDARNPVGFRAQGGAVNGESDYAFDQIFIQRAADLPVPNFRNNQVAIRDAGMRSVMHPLVLQQLQQNPLAWMVAYNVAMKLPRVPFEVYANASAANRVAQTATFLDGNGVPAGILTLPAIFGEAGVALVLVKGAFKVNFNALQSPILRPNYFDQSRSAKWFEYLSWSFDLKKLNPYDLVRELKF